MGMFSIILFVLVTAFLVAVFIASNGAQPMCLDNRYKVRPQPRPGRNPPPPPGDQMPQAPPMPPKKPKTRVTVVISRER
jgi:hypothetical protein